MDELGWQRRRNCARTALCTGWVRFRARCGSLSVAAGAASFCTIRHKASSSESAVHADSASRNRRERARIDNQHGIS